MKTLVIAWLLLGAAPFKEAEPGLLAQAKVKPEEARQTALEQIKNGTVKSEEIERENGKLVYSFDIKVKGKPGIDEVAIDAMTGAVVEHTHETPKDEANEAAKDRAK